MIIRAPTTTTYPSPDPGWCYADQGLIDTDQWLIDRRWLIDCKCQISWFLGGFGQTEPKQNVIILDGYSEIAAHVWSDLCYLICLKNLFRWRAVTNAVFFSYISTMKIGDFYKYESFRQIHYWLISFSSNKSHLMRE